METDPIVEDIRKNSEKLTQKAGGTLHGLVEFLILEQKKSGRHLERFSPRPKLKATGTNENKSKLGSAPGL